MKKYRMELVMACLLLLCFFVLSREAAVASRQGKEAGVIVIDPGHGGADPGMLGVHGLEEKEINLSIAKKLKTDLEKAGFRVVLTREQDCGLYEEGTKNKKAQDMQRRVQMIQELEPLLTISIHQNSYPDGGVRGPQVFFYQGSKEGESLAAAIQEELNKGLSVKRPRTIKGNKTYYLLKKSPGLVNIVECGFLTNPEEAHLLQKEEYQEKVAFCVTKGILRYCEGREQ